MKRCATDPLREWLRLLPGLFIAVLLAACEDFPRDPGGTLERVRNGELRVGLRESEPWAIRNNDVMSGVEVRLVEQLAQSLNAKIRWVTPGPATVEIFEALYRGQLDLVIGGITLDNPWSGRVTFTRPYLDSATVIAASRWQLTSLTGESVLVDPAFPHMQKLKDLGAIPVFRKRAPADPQLEVKPFWAVSGNEKVIRNLTEERHVFALPPGENAWLVYVDGFLQSNRDTALRGLREAAE